MASNVTAKSNPQVPKPPSRPISSAQPNPLSLDIPDSSQSNAESSISPSKPYPRRIFSDPLPPSSPSQFSSILGRKKDNAKSPTSGRTPTSPRSVKFGEGNNGPGELGKSRTMSGLGRGDGSVKRRSSSEARMNVHTECGRHSDDWLFGGFSMANVVKMFWPSGKKDAKGKEKAVEEDEQDLTGNF